MLRARILPALVLGLALTGCGDGGDGAAEGDVTVEGTDALEFEPSELSASSGDTLALTCGEVNHTFVIEDGDREIAACDPNTTATGTLDLEPGEYTFYCSVPGHRESGMEGTLTLE